MNDDFFFFWVLGTVRNMFGGDSNNPMLPVFVGHGENRFQYNANALPQLQLFGEGEFSLPFMAQNYDLFINLCIAYNAYFRNEFIDWIFVVLNQI